MTDADAAADGVEHSPVDDEESGHTEPAPSIQGDGVDAGVGRGLLDVEMGPSSALAHLYRGEVHRMKLWRERLDRTSNWAVILLAAVLTWAFSNQGNPHYVLLLGNAAISLFLVIEARRYRAYDVWRSRVRHLQENVWAPGLDPDREIDDAWRRELAADYAQPTLKISAEEAIAHRLRRVYLPLFAILNGAWLLRVTAFGETPWPTSAAVGSIPGWVVTAFVVVLFAASAVVACRPRTWHARGELRSVELRQYREQDRSE
jgi:uncharacterized membrane protein